MSQSYQIVPWFNSKEWFEVYDKIYSAPSLTSKEEALEILLVWKARCPSLPAGIESTLGLLEVHIQDTINAVTNEKLLRLAYATAMMRFVNHMLDAEIAKGTSLHHAARVSDVPDWIIDLRHDTAHNNVLPSIEILRDAAAIGLEWLNSNYWSKHREFIKDFVSGQKEIVTGDNKIAVLINFCASLSICASKSCKIKNLSEIPDINMREAIINDARDLFTNSLDFSNLKTVSITSLINLHNSNTRLLKSRNASALVNKALTSEDSLFLSAELLNYLSESDFHTKSKLSAQYVQCFEVLLSFLQTHDLLMDFVLELIKLTQDDEHDSQQRKLAALWVSEILHSLKKSVLFNLKIKGSDPDESINKKKKDLKQLFHHWFPNEKQSRLLLDLHKSVPTEWTDMKFIQPIISEYNPYLIYFIKPLLDLIEPSVPKTNMDKICKLAKLISMPETRESSAVQPSKIYTVDDLQSSQTNRVVDQDADSDCMEVCEESFEVRYDTVTEDQFQTGIWQRASTNYNWAVCPIGLLPWQTQVKE